MKDKIITCIQCNEPFIFTAEEQNRYHARGFDEPIRCPNCRKKKSKETNINQSWKDQGRKKHRRHKNRKNFNEESLE